MGTAIQMYASAAPADNLASIDVPANGRLVGVDWAVVVAASGADFVNAVHLAFSSTSQFTSNDARATVSVISLSADLTTSGAALTVANKYVSLPEIPVNAGERMYLHATGTAIVLTIRAILHFDFDLDRPRTRLR